MVIDFSSVVPVNFTGGEPPAPLGSSPKTIWVDDDFMPDYPDEHKWNSIQKGVKDAEPGDTVFVFSGSYSDARVNKTINLTGEDLTSTIIFGELDIRANWVNISNFNMSSERNDGITLWYSDSCRISNNIFVRTSGVSLFYSDNGVIVDNSFIQNNDGIRLFGSRNNIINDNTFFNNHQHGIVLSNSTGNVLKNNIMVEDSIYISGFEVEHWNSHSIDTSNTVNGRPVFYWKDISGGTPRSDAGQVILANCTDVIVKDLMITSGVVGIQLGFSSDIEVIENSFHKADPGIYLQFSDGNEIRDNHEGSGWFTIRLHYSDDNTVAHNEFSRLWIESSNENVVHHNRILNGSGISLIFSERNLIEYNNISFNSGGISVWESANNRLEHNFFFANRNGIVFSDSSYNEVSNNSISNSGHKGFSMLRSPYNLVYHNNISDNPVQAVDDDDPSRNDWHHPDLLEGNYWSDYVGLDDGSGTGKHSISGDGIGDTLIPHPQSDFDDYPFIKPGGWAPSPNSPPVADAGGPYFAEEGSPVTLDGNGSKDPDNDDLKFQWDFDNDGVWDTGWSSSPTTVHTWNDDFDGMSPLGLPTTMVGLELILLMSR